MHVFSGPGDEAITIGNFLDLEQCLLEVVRVPVRVPIMEGQLSVVQMHPPASLGILAIHKNHPAFYHIARNSSQIPRLTTM